MRLIIGSIGAFRIYLLVQKQVYGIKNHGVGFSGSYILCVHVHVTTKMGHNSQMITINLKSSYNISTQKRYPLQGILKNSSTHGLQVLRDKEHSTHCSEVSKQHSIWVFQRARPPPTLFPTLTPSHRKNSLQLCSPLTSFMGQMLAKFTIPGTNTKKRKR